jgi:hypothetical protein
MPDEKPSLTNPAARLLKLLETAKQATGGTVSTTFAVILGVKSGYDTAELYRRLAACVGEANRVRELLIVIGNKTVVANFSKHFPSIVEVFTPIHLDGGWNEYKNKIRTEDLAVLRIVVGLLEQHFPETFANQGTLNDLVEKVDKLYQDVLASNLEQNFKKAVLNGLHAIRTSIHNYAISGTDGLTEALSTAMGQVFIYNAYNSGNSSGTEKPKDRAEITQRYLTIMTLVKGLIESAYRAAPHLTEFIKHLLKGGN